MDIDISALPRDVPAESPSSRILDEFALHGYRTLDDEPDPPPLPSSDAVSVALEFAVESLSSLFLNTRLGSDLSNLLYSFVNLFHRKAERLNREFDDNVPALRTAFGGEPTAAIIGGFGKRSTRRMETNFSTVLLHGGGYNDAEWQASWRVNNRKLPQVAFEPDGSREENASPFTRNVAILETLRIGVIVFPGSGVIENLADNVGAMGIPAWRFGKSCG